MKSQIELYDVKLNKNNALAYVRDASDEFVLEPVSLKKDFGQKLSDNLKKLRDSENATLGIIEKSVNGVLSGVIAKDSDGYGHVDWSTVDVDDMTPVATNKLGYNDAKFVNADLKRNSVFGDLATGHVKSFKKDEKAILILSNIDDTMGVNVMADGRDALASGQKLPLADEDSKLSINSLNVVLDEISKREFGADFKYGDAFRNVAEMYGEPIFDFKPGSSEIKSVGYINGSILDVASDIKHFSEENDMSVSDFFEKSNYADGGADTDDARKLSADFEKYLVENTANREVQVHSLSNVTMDSRIDDMDYDYVNFEYVVSGVENMVLDDSSATNYVAEMKKAGFGTSLRSPYSLSKSLDIVETKTREKEYDDYWDEHQMDY